MAPHWSLLCQPLNGINFRCLALQVLADRKTEDMESLLNSNANFVTPAFTSTQHILFRHFLQSTGDSDLRIQIIKFSKNRKLPRQ